MDDRRQHAAGLHRRGDLAGEAIDPIEQIGVGQPHRAIENRHLVGVRAHHPFHLGDGQNLFGPFGQRRIGHGLRATEIQSNRPAGDPGQRHCFRAFRQRHTSAPRSYAKDETSERVPVVTVTIAMRQA